MAMTAERAREDADGRWHRAAERLAELRSAVETCFRGKREAVELTLTAILAEGHVLFEDVPGVGKTTLARTVAAALGCSFKRIQFTSDLLPADIIGVNVFDRDATAFEFKSGPLFANLVLADEINRTTPRTQSALLEAMNVGQVTVDNTTWDLPRPFVVLATQNPLEFAGTYSLPESQLDRFLLRVRIGYPAQEVERDIIRTLGVRGMTAALQPVLEGEEVLRYQELATGVRVGDRVMGYLQSLVGKTRQSRYLALGASPRAAIALYRAAQARALIEGRDYALPDDVKALFLPTCGHRVLVKSFHDSPAERRREADNALSEILETTPIPL